MPFESTDTIARITLPFQSLRRGVDSWRAERREADSLRRAGRELANSPASADDRFQPLLASLSRHQPRLDVLTEALKKSIESERADSAVVAPWLRPLVMLRGISDRALIRYQMQRYHREMDLCYEALARAARRHSGEEVLANATAPVAPSTGWHRTAAHEGRALGAAVLHQLHGKLVPRVSAVAGMAAGWWVASTYTDSHLRSVMNTVGLGRGGTHVVSGTAYKAMSFWLPILAAAVCAYVGDRLARAFRSRYEPVSGDSRD